MPRHRSRSGREGEPGRSRRLSIDDQRPRSLPRRRPAPHPERSSTGRLQCLEEEDGSSPAGPNRLDASGPLAHPTTPRLRECGRLCSFAAEIVLKLRWAPRRARVGVVGPKRTKRLPVRLDRCGNGIARGRAPTRFKSSCPDSFSAQTHRLFGGGPLVGITAFHVSQGGSNRRALEGMILCRLDATPSLAGLR